MRSFIALVALSTIIMAGPQVHADFTIAGWTFETSVPTTAGPHAAELGAGAARRFHSNASATFSNPAGNGSNESFASTHWSVNDYYQFSFSTSGLSGIKITFDQTHDAGGPQFFNVQYSTDQVNYVTLSGYNIAFDQRFNWNSTTTNLGSRREFDFGSALNNSPTASIRLNSQFAPNSVTARVFIDNVFITAVPEPSALLILGACVAPIAFRRQRRCNPA